MLAKKRSSVLLILAMVLMARSPAGQAGPDRPLTEENLTKLIELQIDDSAIASKLKKEGVGFAVDAAAVSRLRKAGASDAVIAAVQAAGSAGQTAAAGKAVTYPDVLKLLQIGLDEKILLERLEKSPTLFTLDASQVEELKRAGATESLLKAMQQGRARPHPASGPKITDFAVVLDCSGSMAEPTRDGQIKIDVAKRVVAELINRMPETLRVTLVIYGYDRDLNCQAVQVARPLAELGTDGKSELAAFIGGLRPVGNTPIARALEITGQELAKNDAPCGLVLLTDGKETCGGNPPEVAAALTGKLRLTYGVNVIGFDVRDDERAALAELARAGKGKYYNAQTAAELIEVVRGIQKELQVVARPAETGRTIRLGAARTVAVLPPTIQLPPMDRIFLTSAGTGAMAIGVEHIARTDKYGQALRIPPSVKAAKFDLWWVPQRGRAVRMIKDLALDEPSLAIKPENYLGLVRATGKGLPAANVLLLTPVGTADFAIRAEAAQSAPGYGHDMVVAPGQYDLWIEPADGGKSERLAEQVEVTAGKVTLVE
jgi:Ca-activated chloride channel family protein